MDSLIKIVLNDYRNSVDTGLPQTIITEDNTSSNFHYAPEENFNKPIRVYNNSNNNNSRPNYNINNSRPTYNNIVKPSYNNNVRPSYNNYISRPSINSSSSNSNSVRSSNNSSRGGINKGRN